MMCVMNPKRDNIEIMINDEADEVIEELFKSLQNNLKVLMKGSEFVFDYIHLLYYKCHKYMQIAVHHIYILLVG